MSNHRTSRATWVQGWVFTIAVTGISRLLIFRDRLLRRVKLHDRQDGAIQSGRYSIRSGANQLDGVYIAPNNQAPKAGLLICHGIGETLAHWNRVQGLLAQHGIATLIFSYSGYEKSTGKVTVLQCEQDAIAAYSLLRDLLPDASISILGYSLGSGVAGAVASKVSTSWLFLCASYTSLRDASRAMGTPKSLSRLLPPTWDNKAAIANNAVPTVVLHGEEDRLFPALMAKDLAGSNSHCELIIVPGVTHNSPIYSPNLLYWSAVISRLCR